VIGSAADYVFSHTKWAKFHNLPFRPLDTIKRGEALRQLLSAYGFNRRTVFVDRKGKSHTRPRVQHRIRFRSQAQVALKASSSARSRVKTATPGEWRMIS